MVKCIKCGEDTDNFYTVKASVRVARAGYWDTYESLETAGDYACTSCVIKSRKGSFIFVSICIAIAVYIAHSNNLTPITAIGLIALGVTWLRYFILRQDSAEDKPVINNGCWGSKFIAGYYGEELRKRHPGCTILYINPDRNQT